MSTPPPLAAAAPDAAAPLLLVAAAPPLLLQAVNERISGEPLNAMAEAKARGNGWH